MPVPKRRRSSAVRDAGRSHLALKKVQLGKCSHCQAAIKTHQMCPVCGYYKGRQILDIVKKKEEVEVRNGAENIIFQTEKFIKDNKDKLKDDDKKQMEDKMEALKKVKDSKDLEPIRTAIKDMEEVVQKIGAAMYQQQAQDQQNSSSAGAEKTEDKKLFEKNLDLCIQRIKDKVGVLPDEINALKNSFLDMKLVQQDKDLKKKVKTLLAGAIKYSARTLLEALIEKGVSKEKALCLAVENVESNLSAVAMVEYLLNKNADPNCKCSLWSPLVIISKKLKQAIIDQNNLKNYIEISQLLLKAGANYGEKYKLITLETINLKTPPLLYEWEFAGFENKEEWFKFIGVDEKYLDPDQNKSGIAFAGKCIKTVSKDSQCREKSNTTRAGYVF